MYKRISIIIFTLFISVVSQAQIIPEWTELVGLDYNAVTGDLTKTAIDGWNSGARSWNRIGPNENGVISYTVQELTAEKIIGLSSLNRSYSIGSIDYALMLSGNKVNIYEKGKFRGKFGTCKVGDVFTIEREGGSIIFRKNSRQFRQRPTNPVSTLYAEVAIYTQGATISGISTSFKKPIAISYIKHDISCTTTPDGTIDVTVIKGKAPFTFSWNDAVTTEDRANLDIGKYTLTIYDATGEYYKESIEINSEVAWIELEGVGIETPNNTLIKLPFDKSNPYKIGKAISQNTLLANTDGYVSYTVNENSTSKVFSLTNDVPINGLADMDFTYYLEKDQLYIFERGKLMGKFGSFNIGEELKIERIGGLVLYSRDNKLVFKSNTDPNKDLKVKVELYDEGATFSNMTTNFCNLSLKVDYIVAKETPAGLGSIELTPFGGTPPYYYFWSDGDQSKNRYNLESGIYGLIVVDTLLDSIQVQIPLGMEIAIDSATLVGMTFENDQLDKTAVDGWGNGKVTLMNEVFKNTLEGEVMVEVNEMNKEWTYGLRKDINSSATIIQDYSYGFHINSDNKLTTYDNYDGLKYFGTVTTGDVLSIERNQMKIFYKKNGIVLRQIDFSGGDSFKIDFSLYSMMKLGTITIIHFPHWPKPTAIITHNICYGSNGAIDLNVSGALPTSYSWVGPNNFTATTQDISGLTAGAYTVTITYATGAPIIRTYNVGYEVNWENKILVTANGSELTDQASNGYGNSGASSTNLLSKQQSGWLEFSVTNGPSTTGDNLAIGLTEIDDNLLISDIDYGLGFKNIDIFPYPFTIHLRLVYVIENGSPVNVISNYSTNDVFKIDYNVANNEIKYYKNGGIINWFPYSTPIYSSTNVPQKNYRVDATLAENGGGIIIANTSFGCQEQFVKLKDKLDGGSYYYEGRTLCFKYTEKYREGNLNYKIYEFKDQVLLSSSNFIIPKKYGNNWFHIDMAEFSYQINHYYVLEVIDEKSRKEFLRFCPK